MFKSKQVITIITLLAMVSMINLIIGCDRSLESEVNNRNDINTNTLHPSNQNNNLESLQSFFLEDENNVSITEYQILDDEVKIRLNYYDQNDNIENRDLYLSKSLLEFRLHDVDSDEIIYSYRSEINGDSIIYHSQTPSGNFTYNRNREGNYNQFIINNDTLIVEFLNQEEFQHAVDLFENYSQSEISKMKLSEQVLFNKINQVYSFYSTNWSNESYDVYLATNLVGDYNFIKWYVDNIGDENLDRDKACRMANYLMAATCWCGPWCMLVCIPAAGVATACFLADVFE
ncbi:MAG: hypothetical protein DWP97_08715 [Calditrichaeota bacterium]|nr:MAG: hypothetical protein DWP97_08715 [Calditrichota bacterium]